MVSHSKVVRYYLRLLLFILKCCESLIDFYLQLGEMVALHLMSLMEALQECQSSVLTKLLPLWAPVLHTQNVKVGRLLSRSSSLRARLEQLLRTGALSTQSSINGRLRIWNFAVTSRITIFSYSESSNQPNCLRSMGNLAL